MRNKIMDAIVRKYDFRDETLVRDALKRMSDNSLIAFAIDRGIDVDAVLSNKEKVS